MESIVISGNSETGINLNNSDYATVITNLIGTNAGGNTAMGNYFGIVAFNAARNNLIDGNTISGNYVGISLEQVGSFNTLRGNRIGIKAASLSALPNDYGVWVDCTADLTMDANTISGNMYGGMQLGAVQASRFSGNTIGGAVGNGGGGIQLVPLTCGSAAAVRSEERRVGKECR